MNYAAGRSFGGLPVRDKKLDVPEKLDPKLTGWKRTPPAQPGWYWCAAPGLWPQCIEMVYRNGKIILNDRHTLASKLPIWTHFLGPIDMPENPSSISRR